MIIRHCNIIEEGTVLENRKVSISDGRITRIEEDGIEDVTANDHIGSDDAGATVIDAGGAFLMPGLINLHVHINRRNISRQSGTFRSGAPAIENLPDAERMIYALKNAWYEMSREGVTTMRDLCSVGRTATRLKRSIDSGIINGPRLVVCGLGIAATNGHETHRYKGAVEADGPDEIVKVVREEIKQGADFIKVMASGGLGGMPEKEHPNWAELSEKEIAAAVYAAHSHRKDVTVHAMGKEPVLAALRAGVDGIEHGTMLCDEALDIMEERGVYCVPTASGIAAVAKKEEAAGNTEMSNTIRELVVEPQLESIKRAKKRGILMGAGSDTLGSVLEELLIFESCGLSRKEALAAATSNAAHILHMEDALGHVKEGYIADLILLEKNPLDDLHNISTVVKVIRNGSIVDDKWLMNLQ